ncbi:MAG: hypothetical protein AAFN74_13655 [Myxococcota bacterium]
MKRRFAARHRQQVLVCWGALACWSGLGCTDGSEHARAIAVLIDVSGTYADQAPQVVKTVKAGILPAMKPTDTLTVIRIDEASYGQDNIAAKLTLAARRSEANAQKLKTARALDTFASSVKPARHTDITGAIMLAAEHLREAEPVHKMMIIFSDLREDLPAGTRRELDEGELEGMRVLALNVKRLEADNRDPQVYRERMNAWKRRLQGAGASEFRVFVDERRLLEGLVSRTNSPPPAR